MSKHIVVVGGGVAGLCAALTALQGGSAVTLLEKGPRLGGSGALSSGMAWSYQRLEDARRVAPNGDEQLQRLVIDGIGETLPWLGEQGVELSGHRPMFAQRHGWPIAPSQFVQAMRAKVTAAGGTILVNAPMVSLASDGGRVVGVLYAKAETGDVVSVDCDAVILATGGFQGNAELLSRHVLRDVDSVYHRSNPWSTGDGLLAASAVGALTSTGLGGFYGHAMPAPPARISEDRFAEVSQYYGGFAVALNMNGVRFADESQGMFEENVNWSLAQQPDGCGFYVVDAELEASQPFEDLPRVDIMIERAEEIGGVVVRASTLDELSDLLAEYNLPRGRTRLTLHEYADAVATGRPDLLPVPRRGNIVGLHTPPFTAVAVKAAITFTTGGIAVDDSMAVLRRSLSSSPRATYVRYGDSVRWCSVPGLYAAGSDIGGVSNVGYLGGLAVAMITGRRAGQAAAT